VNTVTFPKIQVTDQNLNRIQNNIANTFNDVGNDINLISIVGEVKFSPLTLSQFQQQAGIVWVKADGITSVVNTQYNKLTNALVAPNVTAPAGTNAYIRIN
jgi:hypothetical protein